ncbi:stage III sporulation protein AF [Virgibacillus kekensis]|uniref:Stage III sporulation protein AF n=1 Tax=Virgibacillus kekensis TaxID=202261 RepID=A0ABV9DMJ4_9BACI
MEMVIQWVTQIIIFLLVASLIDLLIPATSMKKYIKLVVGLILVLIFLKPIFMLFDFNAQDALERSFAQIEGEAMEAEQVENLTKIQKKEIQASQTAYILEEMAVQLKDLAEAPLQEEYQAAITHIDFRFSDESNPTYESLKEVIVFLQESSMGEGAVNAVDDVVINTDKPVTDESEADTEGIKLLLQEVWELKNKKLTISWEGGAP